MASQAIVDRIKERLTQQKTEVILVTETIEDEREFVLSIHCYNQYDCEKCQSQRCCCDCHKPEVKKMSVNKKILEPNEWSLDKKKTILEKKGILVSKECKPYSEEERKFVEEEFSKLNLEEVNQMVEKKNLKNKTNETEVKLTCTKCKNEYFWKPREGTPESKIEKVKKSYKCIKCRTTK